MNMSLCDACGRRPGDERSCEHTICDRCWNEAWDCPICEDDEYARAEEED